ncbi:hypothetical protein [Acidiphilium iwatense]|uniref:YkgJ family cysteine cluster protein n=1 Tax=Acidiphilium iwatense TaxID=768198 RepID=A0ABS9DZQ9_9PROT|nr:hypothetical protein [Acidiphilium iwatense]MCF3948248.1 hypothetical protein [Acidiphilium iwatense]
MSEETTSRQAFRTIEEAKALQLPKTPRETVELVEIDFAFAARGNAGRLSRLKRLYHAVDLLMSEVSPLAVCRKGCAHCCYIDVVITDIEADYIARNTGHKKNVGASRTSGRAVQRSLFGAPGR